MSGRWIALLACWPRTSSVGGCWTCASLVVLRLLVSSSSLSPAPSYLGYPLHQQHQLNFARGEGEPGMRFAPNSLMGNHRALP